jgi:hypothetical protein
VLAYRKHNLAYKYTPAPHIFIHLVVRVTNTYLQKEYTVRYRHERNLQYSISMSYIFRSSSLDKFLVDVFIVNLLVEMNCLLQSQSLTSCAVLLMDWELDCWELDMSSAQYQGRLLR